MITPTQSADGSFTAYSQSYGEHYHSTKDGALQESLCKHVLPALEHVAGRGGVIRILDICFGLGFNTLATIMASRQRGMTQKLHIVSPELDEALVRSLAAFPYPEAFDPFIGVIQSIARSGFYEDEHVRVEVVFGDARAFLATCNEPFDIVYQDAFSPAANPALWSVEYFAQIARLLKPDGLLTTYSTALKTRLALYENGFRIYLNAGEGYRNATLASRQVLPYPEVDMRHKIACNPGVSPINDVSLKRQKIQYSSIHH
ncbi:MAG: hypothetical protein JXK05_09015 [Campylobacterales bacterium]|nr:hypothetical protein [Campylobacterales bacterium]